ncbi:M23 family metallopeptidase [Patescibacteria group bacterium]|nr:M23 family metallopeptidase [Patescibacteria group bacterium]MBU1500850.1 M23 family metallopeptidase [Patescibacteria group bacterium]MBU2080905.1 M23 family metallopeptidase [Patescibacteria group bacterium]MBU2124010.1 M23 family metallopeptidase [Patescibacteria group bacterium]MBU2194699.1 M23 family metallopeptidase [Patescibacteria group bacterium]
MSTFTHPARALVFLALFMLPVIPLQADAATRSYSKYWQDVSSREGSSYAERSSSRSRYSSAIQKEIKKLDDDIVENLPIPIVLGLSQSQITADFGDDRDGGSRSHAGQDLIAPRGAFIASPTDAVVTRTGEGGSSGIYVYTANPGGETFAYMHLDRIADGIKPGTVLTQGDLIGYVGDSGNAKGGVTHLHFEIRDGREAVDPYPRLTKEFSLEQKINLLRGILAELIKEQKKLS